MTDAEDEEAQRLMAQWTLDGDLAADVQSDDDIKDEGEFDDYDEYIEQFRRDVSPGDDEIDHLLLGCSDLEKARVMFEELTGTQPTWSATLNGLGIKSGRVAFKEAIFLDIIGPDPNKADMKLAQELAKIPDGELVPMHYAVRSKSIMADKKWQDYKLEADTVTMVGKDKGMANLYDLCILEGHEAGGLLPFFIDWRESFHGSGKAPIVGEFGKVTVTADASSPVHKLLKGIDGIELKEGDDNLEFTFTSAKGKHKVATSSPIGIEFPK